MPTFSLINVYSKTGDKVDGHWIQDHIGDLESAKLAAVATERANGQKIKVAIVAGISSVTPSLTFWTNLTRLA